MFRSYRLFTKVIVVESPVKVPIIQKYVKELHSKYKQLHFGSKELMKISSNDAINEKVNVIATIGHLKFLEDIKYTKIKKKDEYAIKPIWKNDESKKNKISEINSEIKILSNTRNSELIIATDPDREGELIASHVESLASKKNIPISRMYIHAITLEGIHEALKNRKINGVNTSLVQAASVRHILDRIFGFMTSRFVNHLQKDLKSVGRVQTAALILLNNRNESIKSSKLNKRISYSINVHLKLFTGKQIVTKLNTNTELKTKEEYEKYLSSLTLEAGKTSNMFDLRTKLKIQVHQDKPPMPLTMQTLILEAVNKLGLLSKDVAAACQELFNAGLISYPRTDSIKINDETITNKIQPFIEKIYGASYFSNPFKSDKTKKKSKKVVSNVEDAHEAIQPTNLNVSTSSLKSQPGRYISNNAKLIYQLIHSFTIAAFLKAHKYEALSQKCIWKTGEYININAKHTLFEGWKVVMKDLKNSTQFNFEEQNVDIKSDVSEDESNELINRLKNKNDEILFEVTSLKMKEIESKVPTHYNEGKLIEDLKSNKIGRPSTYPSIVKLLIDRGYVTMGHRTSVIITERGVQLVQLAQTCFSTFIDLKFTQKFEKKLDKIAKTNKDLSIGVLNNFYSNICSMITDAVINIKKIEEKGNTKLMTEHINSTHVMPFIELCHDVVNFNQVLFHLRNYMSLHIPLYYGSAMLTSITNTSTKK